MQIRRRLAPTTLVLAMLLLIVGRVAESAAPEAALRSAAPSPAPVQRVPGKINLASVAGVVEVADAGTDAWKPGVEGAMLNAEDQVRTGNDGFAMLAYADATLRVMPASLAILGRSSIRLKQGSTWMRMKKSGGTFKIDTPSVAVSVCGTLVRAAVLATGSTVSLVTGCVDLLTTKDAKSARMNPLEQAVAPNAGGLQINKMTRSILETLRADYQAAVNRLPPREGDSEGDSGASEGFGAPAGGSGTQNERNQQKPSGGKTDRRSSSSLGTRSSLSNLQGMMDSRSTGLAAPAGGTAGAPSSGTQTAGSAPLPNSTSQSRTVQTQPGGASSRAQPTLLTPVVVPGAAPGGVGAAGAPPPR